MNKREILQSIYTINTVTSENGLLFSDSHATRAPYRMVVGKYEVKVWSKSLHLWNTFYTNDEINLCFSCLLRCML